MIVSVEVDRLDAWRKDWEIPRRYGMSTYTRRTAAPGGFALLFTDRQAALQVVADELLTELLETHWALLPRFHGHGSRAARR